MSRYYPGELPTLTLIDGSGFIFRAYHALPHLSTTRGVPTNAVYGFTTMLLKALREHAPTHVALVFDASGRSFRHALDERYKANRPAAPEDLTRQFPLIRDVASALNVPVLEEEGVEADDVIGTLARHARAQGWEVVIVTGDKDFAQLVDERISLYDPMAEASGRGGWTSRAEVEKKLGVPPEQAVEYQTILGDKIDNVPGIPGVGEVTAAALIRKFGSIEEMLRRSDEIPAAVARGGEKVREKILANVERLRLNRKLVELRCDVPLPYDAAAFERRAIDLEKTRALFSELEFSRLLKELPAPPPTARREKVEILLTRAALEEAILAARGAGAIGLRAALAGENPRRAPLFGIAFAAAGRAFYLPLGHSYLGAPAQLSLEQVREVLRPLLRDPAIAKHGHDLKSEMQALSAVGLDLEGPGFDTEIASRLLIPTRREHALADVARERLSCELPVLQPASPAKRASRSPPWELPVERVAEVTAPCAAVLPDLSAHLERALADEGLLPLYRDIERPLIPILARMERTGIRVDTSAMAAMSEEFGNAMRTLEARIHSAAGRAFHIGSTRELAKVLFEELKLPVQKRLKTGPSTDQDVLERLAEEHPLPALVLEHRSLSKLKSTYVDALPQLVEQDGRIHTTFHQGGAATGRLSSSDPNLQNIPIRTELSKRIRAAFVADSGQLIVSADYSQVELRILAHFARDPALLDSFRRHEDVHAATAAETFGVSRESVTPNQRRIAKVLNFGIAYGLSAFGLSQRLDMPPQEAQAIIDRYFTRYAAVKQWLEETVTRARRDGEVRTLFGRKRALPELMSRNAGLRQGAERMAVNTPIQGTAADLIKMAMIRVEAALAREGVGARLLLQVHDELVLEVPERDAERLSHLLCTEMAAAGALAVPLEVEVGTGKSWAEAH